MDGARRGVGLRVGLGLVGLWEKRRGEEEEEAMEVSIAAVGGAGAGWSPEVGKIRREEEDELSRSLYSRAVGTTRTDTAGPRVSLAAECAVAAEHGTVAVRAVAADVSSSRSEASETRLLARPDGPIDDRWARF
jgi:hypothetical protein